MGKSATSALANSTPALASLRNKQFIFSYDRAFVSLGRIYVDYVGTRKLSPCAVDVLLKSKPDAKYSASLRVGSD